MKACSAMTQKENQALLPNQRCILPYLSTHHQLESRWCSCIAQIVLQLHWHWLRNTNWQESVCLKEKTSEQTSMSLTHSLHDHLRMMKHVFRFLTKKFVNRSQSQYSYCISNLSRKLHSVLQSNAGTLVNFLNLVQEKSWLLWNRGWFQELKLPIQSELSLLCN